MKDTDPNILSHTGTWMTNILLQDALLSLLFVLTQLLSNKKHTHTHTCWYISADVSALQDIQYFYSGSHGDTEMHPHNKWAVRCAWIIEQCVWVVWENRILSASTSVSSYPENRNRKLSPNLHFYISCMFKSIMCIFGRMDLANILWACYIVNTCTS